MKIEYLRASQINLYRECSAYFYFLNFTDIKTANKPSLAFGSAIHSTLEKNFRQKIESRQDLTIAESKYIFSNELGTQLNNVERCDLIGYDSQRALEATGLDLIELYQRTHAYRIQPKRVEENVQIKLKGYPYGLSGTVDLLDDDNNLIDHKTSGRDYKQISESYRIQVGGAYPILMEALLGEPINSARIDYMIRKSENNDRVKVRPIAVDIDKKYFFSVFEQVSKGIEADIFSPCRDYMFCSQKYCKFHDHCVKQFGGVVKK